MTKRVAVYAGSFDPPTNGHLWMIEETLKIFDEVIIAIAENPAKKYLFSTSQRQELLVQALAANPNINIGSVTTHVLFGDEFVAEYAADQNAVLVRGIRNVVDYEYEKSMAEINSKIGPTVPTIMLTPPASVANVSSSAVKGLIGPHNWEKIVSQFVPVNVLNTLKSSFARD